MVITRDIINKNIKFHDVGVDPLDNTLSIESYDYPQLNRLVDGYKNLFESLGCQPGQKAILGEKLILRQIALVMACSELGINITIVNNAEGSLPNTNSAEVDLLGPFDYLCGAGGDGSPKIQALSKHSRHIVNTNEKLLDYTVNKKILATPDTTFLSCITSDPKKDARVINHSHNFIASLIKRNSKMFWGSAATMSNLNHGSGPAAYFLPVLVADNVTDFYHFPTALMRGIGKLTDIKQPTDLPSLDVIFDFLNQRNIVINHLHFPYNKFIDLFLDNVPSASQCSLYTLSFIKEEHLAAVRKGQVKDIISLYGTSEISGPVLIAQASDLDFQEKTFKKVDDFYGCKISDQGVLEVDMPVYNKTISTGDNFEIVNDKFILKGRKHQLRINDLYVDVDRYYDFLFKHNIDATIVMDSVKNSIYLAIWSGTVDDQIIENFSSTMRVNSDDRHYISKYDFLNKENFKYHGDLDLAEYFRKKS